jgi:hypothetical protein
MVVILGRVKLSMRLKHARLQTVDGSLGKIQIRRASHSNIRRSDLP